MLVNLQIRNYIFIDNMDIEFSEGLTIFSGETGAGKSIIIGAVNIILGEKVSANIVKKGEEFSEIVGVFNIASGELRDKLEIEEEEIFIRRRIFRDGKSKCYINERLVPLSRIRSIGEFIVDLHGQHKHQRLLAEDEQRDILDRFAKNHGLRKEIEDLYNKKKELESRLDELVTKKRILNEKRELYEFQKNEIARLDIKKDEDIELEKEYKMLSRLDMISGIAQSIREDVSCTYQISRISENLKKLGEYDKNYEKLHAETENSLAMLNEIEVQVSDFKENLEASPARLEAINSRLLSLDRIKKKYGGTLEAVIEYRDKITDDLKMLTGDSEAELELKDSIEKINCLLLDKADELSISRKKASEELCTLITSNFKDLAMDKVKIFIEIRDKKDRDGNNIVDKTGKDDISFLIKTNPGLDSAPLRDIVSGGELSRVMLAIKSVLADYDRVHTLIFDEIDTGLGGKIAFMLGKKLKRISSKHQVICITHIPQVAVFGTDHKFVHKETKDDKVYANIISLDEETRIKEIGRMLGGNKITDTTLEHAKELYEAANL